MVLAIHRAMKLAVRERGNDPDTLDSATSKPLWVAHYNDCRQVDPALWAKVDRFVRGGAA
jgi:hypothetical protein